MILSKNLILLLYHEQSHRTVGNLEKVIMKTVETPNQQKNHPLRLHLQAVQDRHTLQKMVELGIKGRHAWVLTIRRTVYFTKNSVARLIGKLNTQIANKEMTPTILFGPARWGTTTPSLLCLKSLLLILLVNPKSNGSISFGFT